MAVTRTLATAIALTIALACSMMTIFADNNTSLTKRWFYLDRDFRKPENVEPTRELFQRAAQAGYNGVVVSFLGWVADATPADRDSLRQLRAAATENALDLVACVAMSNSSSAMANDPNLAEGIPVKDALFVAHGSDALPTDDPSVRVPNSGFEETEGDNFLGWEVQDAPGVATFADHSVARSEDVSARAEHLDKGWYGGARLAAKIPVRPFRQYRISVWVKTQDFDGYAYLLVIAPTEKQRDLANSYPSIQPTQDWTRYDLLVNSLNFDKLVCYFGVNGGNKGRLWWDDVTIKEVGLLNVLRREGTPLTVRSEDGTLFEEGRDFASIRDPKLAAIPTDHDPVALRLTPDSRITEGTRLLINYYHSLEVGGYVTSCMSEPKVYDNLRKQLVAVNTILHPDGFLMYDDEIRVANWDESCQRRHLTPGQILADKVRTCTKMIQELRPDAEIWDWSDMFCPLENAIDDYYAVNGTWAGSWEGLAPSVGIVNWGNHLEGKNLNWFADRGHRQILAGFYDGSGYPIAKWLNAGEGLPGIVGAMYTTWIGNYSDLETFAQQAWGGK
jgi:hypothetical protein